MKARLLLVLLLASAGCSDDISGAPPYMEATAPPTSPTASPPAPPGPKAAKDGDVDGDGTVDKVSATDTLLSVTLSKSGKVVTAAVSAEVPPRVLGSADVDRDGYAEVFLETVQGASTSFATPYRWDGTSLREVQLDGAPARLGIGGSVTHSEGFSCGSDGTLQVHKAESLDGERFTVRTETFRLRGAALVRAGTDSTMGTQGDPAVTDASSVSCGSVEPGA